MGYILVIIGALAVTAQNCVAKQYARDTKGISGAMGIYMLINFALGMIFYVILSGFKLVPNVVTIIFSVLFAIVVFMFTYSKFKALERTDVVSVVVFSGCGKVVIPVLFGLFLFREKITLSSFAAICILTFIMVMPAFTTERQSKKSFKRSAYFWCLLFMFFSGMTAVVSKLYVSQKAVLPESVFCFWTNVFLLPYVVISNIRANGMRQMVGDFGRIGKKLYLLLVLSAVFANAETLLSMLALKKLNIIVFTIFNTSLELVLSAAVSVVVYKEKLTVHNIVGVIGSIVAVTLNVL